MYRFTTPTSSIALNSTQFALLSLLAIWALVWKGWALWRAGRNNQKVWFVVLLLVNSLGVLDIVYLFALQPKQTDAKTSR